jgi:hypothetical protein
VIASAFIPVILRSHLHLVCLHHKEKACIWRTKLPVIAYAENNWLIIFLRTFERGRPPIVAPRNINLFLCNKFRLRRERRPLAEGPKKHLPFARIANLSESRDPPRCRSGGKLSRSIAEVASLLTFRYILGESTTLRNVLRRMHLLFLSMTWRKSSRQWYSCCPCRLPKLEALRQLLLCLVGVGRWLVSSPLLQV